MKYPHRVLSILLLAGILLFTPTHSVAAADSDDFVITVSGSSFTIKTNPLETYNYNVDCDNDGTDEATAQTGDYTCNYPENDQYTIRIKDNAGDRTGFPHLFMDGWYQAQYVQSVDQWGTMEWSSMNKAFQGCTNLVINAVDPPDLSNVTDLSYMFQDASSMNAELSSWDVSTVTNMAVMFQGATAFNQDLSGWDVSHVTNMASMFSGASAFNQDLSGWNTASVETIGFMFNNASAFDQDLSGWNVSSVTDAYNMFQGVTLSPAHYDALLKGWNAQTLQSGVEFSGGSSKYCLGDAARQNMIDTDNWDITDGGKDCSAYTATLVNPANRALLDDKLIFFRWEPVAGIARYKLEIKKVSDNSLVYSAFYDAAVRCDATACSVPLSLDFEPGVKYKWHVISWDDANNRGGVSVWWVFTQKLVTPVLRSPGDGSTIVSYRPTFKWYPVYSANEFVIELLDDGGTRVDIWSWKNPICGTYCEFRVPVADNLGTNYGDYQWRVRARNDERASDWSDLRSFIYE